MKPHTKVKPRQIQVYNSPPEKENTVRPNPFVL